MVVNSYKYTVKLRPKKGKHVRDPEKSNKAHAVGAIMKLDGFVKFDEAINIIKTCHMYSVVIVGNVSHDEAIRIAKLFENEDSDYEAIVSRD